MRKKRGRIEESESVGNRGRRAGASPLALPDACEEALMDKYTYPKPGKEPFATPESEMREAWEEPCAG